MNPVQAGFFSMTGTPPGGEDAYLRWHLLDHLPEQYSIPGVRLGTRWRSDDACVALRLAADERLVPVRHVVSYLMADPVEATLLAFAQLGRRCAEAGRFPEPAPPSHLLGAFSLLRAYASPRVLVSAEAVAFRPHRGIYLLVEAPSDQGDVEGWLRWHHREHVPELLAIDGVAGVSLFRASTRLGVGSDQGERFGQAAWDPGGRLITLLHLDDEVGVTSARLEGPVRSRWAGGSVHAQLAGPFRTMVSHEVWPAT